MTTKIKKKQAIDLCIRNGIEDIDNSNCTFSSLNASTPLYWANPRVSLLRSDWWIILNDYRKQQLHVFHVPAYSVNKYQFVCRNDNPDRIDMEVYYNDPQFEDSRSNVKFSQWYFKTVDY